MAPAHRTETTSSFLAEKHQKQWTSGYDGGRDSGGFCANTASSDNNCTIKEICCWRSNRSNNSARGNISFRNSSGNGAMSIDAECNYKNNQYLIINKQQSIGSDDGCRNNSVPGDSTSAVSSDCDNEQCILFKEQQKQQSFGSDFGCRSSSGLTMALAWCSDVNCNNEQANAASGDGSCDNKPIPLRCIRINNQPVAMTNIL